MPWIAGVDGCKAGWIAALREVQRRELACQVFANFADVLDSGYRPGTVAVDIPIGLPDRGSRQCDIEARRLLGRRGCCVFPAPIRPVLATSSYREASALSRSINDGKGLPAQAFALVRKIAEVDREARARPRGLVREVHPEVCFCRLNDGEPVRDSKRTEGGLARRRQLLEQVYGRPALDSLEQRLASLPGAGPGDLYDALAALETARRIAEGLAVSLPATPPVDSCGLRMEIVY